MPQVLIIAAVAANGVIGRDNQLLWQLPEDMRFFRETTKGKPVIMGRKTWESLPPRFRPLPGRRNVVITRQESYQAADAEIAHSLSDALNLCAEENQVFVIGGAEIYAQAMSIADQLLLTEVSLTPDGDAHFPHIDPQHWQEIKRSAHCSENGTAYAFVVYQRI